MPLLRFAKALHRHVECPDAEVDAQTVGGALEAYFQRHPNVRGYVLDERGRLRMHMLAFVDGRPIRDRAALDDAVSGGSVVEVIQALSGG